MINNTAIISLFIKLKDFIVKNTNKYKKITGNKVKVWILNGKGYKKVQLYKPIVNMFVIP